MTALSKKAEDLLRRAKGQGAIGYPVVGIPDRTAVEELVAAGLVTAGENESRIGYRSRIYAVDCRPFEEPGREGRVVHLPVLIPGWIRAEVGGEEVEVLHVEVAPDEAQLRRDGASAFEEDDSEDGRNLTVPEAESIVSALCNDSFREIASAAIYT